MEPPLRDRASASSSTARKAAEEMPTQLLPEKGAVAESIRFLFRIVFGNNRGDFFQKLFFVNLENFGFWNFEILFPMF